jgi:8-oxo-dGTP pyrophosphatase MutT (NUDIX family)
MEVFSTLKDSDIFENSFPEPKEYTVRPTAKGIVLDSDGNIALLEASGHFLFPGGGVEDGESPEEAFARECMEEIGCHIQITSCVGMGIQHRAEDAKKYEIYFYIAKVLGEKGAPTTTSRGELDCLLSWKSEGEVKAILENQWERIPKDDYPSQFNTRSHYTAFEKYLKEKI